MSDNGFQKENTTFAGLKLFKHILFTSCFVIETYEIGTSGESTCTANHIYAYSAEASSNENMFVQPYQNDTVRIRLRSSILVE